MRRTVLLVEDEAKLADVLAEHPELRDYHHLRGVGADAVDKLSRSLELKATYRAMPDEITLTATEAVRALLAGEKFFLAVVAGLEESYETVVKIFPNPLRTLEFKPSTSVTLAGITSRKSAIEIRSPRSRELRRRRQL